MNSILIITSLLIIFSIFSHALIKLVIGKSNNPDKKDL
ncbi:YnaM/YnfT family protein [Escherichia coli]|nr:YnaM/YnfT family protein [Escherichia coli]